MSVSTTETAESTIKTMNGIDAARRVGWAKAYANADKLDDALRDCNLFRGDRDAFRKGLSFMFGLFMEWTHDERHRQFHDVLLSVVGGDALLDPKVAEAGRREARKIRDMDEVADEERELVRRVKRDGEYRRLFRNAEDHARRKFAARYGFTDVEHLERICAAWQAATGAESSPTLVPRRPRRSPK